MFRGAFTALVTPFRDGAVDVTALEQLVESQIEGGIDGLVPCGTTGESCTLSFAEQVKVIETVVSVASNRVPVIGGAGSNNTAEAVQLAKACKQAGCAASLQIAPYYNKPTQQGIRQHILAAAEGSGLPVVIYNVPGRTCSDVLPATVAELAAHELVVGIKEATADTTRASELRERCGDSFALLSGDDFTLLPFLAVGGDGVISVGSNVVPGLFARMCQAAHNSKLEEARALHYRLLPLMRALFCSANPIPLKSAMAKLGVIAPEIRAPLHMLDESGNDLAALMDILQQVKGAP